MNDLRSQLAPGWSGVNIGIMVLLFIAIPPLGLLMLGYIIWGRQLDLDFTQRLIASRTKRRICKPGKNWMPNAQSLSKTSLSLKRKNGRLIKAAKYSPDSVVD